MGLPHKSNDTKKTVLKAKGVLNKGMMDCSFGRRQWKGGRNGGRSRGQGGDGVFVR